MSLVSTVLHLIAWSAQVVVVAVALASVRGLFIDRSEYRYHAAVGFLAYLVAFNWPPSPYLVDVTFWDAYNRVAMATMLFYLTRRLTKRTGWRPFLALTGRESVQLYPRRAEW